MKNTLFLMMFVSFICNCPLVGSQNPLLNAPENEMKRCDSHSHKGLPGAKGATGPTGADGGPGANSSVTGNTGSMGSTGATGGPGATGFVLTPGFGSFFSTTGQTVPLGGPIFFENTNAGATGGDFTFTPGVGSDTFMIDVPGNYLISYGVFAGAFATTIPSNGIALTSNFLLLPGSAYCPFDSDGTATMASFEGIFNLAPGPVQLINLGPNNLGLSPPTSAAFPAPVNTTAYISFEFLNPG
jgi:hypothetical protein